VQGVSLTALWTAAQRAQESARPDRLVEDPLAETLAGPEGARIMEILQAGEPPSPTVAIRTRFFDDRIVDRTSAGTGLEGTGLEGTGREGTGREGPARQVVLLGAGMDSRAFRLGLLPHVTVFELDHPELLRLKDQRLERAGAKPTCERRSVPCDLGGAWVVELLSSGFSTKEASVFVAEGLLMYLDEREVDGLLDVLGTLSVPGSTLLADVCGRSLRYSPYMTEWFAGLERAGMAWRFATDEPEVLLSEHGWEADVVRYGDERAHFGRWPGPKVDRSNLAWPQSYLVEGTRAHVEPGKAQAGQPVLG
jgi:O-methyltransferase involved in polyketide biosynthesis